MMNFNITLIKKFNFDILAVYLFFVWKVSPAIYADGFNYDDSHEILITRVDTIYDFFAFADHHFLYALTLYLLAYVIPFSTLQVVNLIFVLVILFCTKKLYEELSFSYLSFLLNVVVLISSPIFLEYSVRIKQYTLDYLLTLLMIFIFVKLEKKEISIHKIILIGVLVSLSSLILLPVFVVFLIINYKDSLKAKNTLYYFISIIFIYYFLNIGSVSLKVFDDKYLDYFSFSFLIDGNPIEEFINLFFSLIVFFRGVSDNGFLFIYLIVLIFGSIKLYKFDRKFVYAFLLLLTIFCIFHLLDLYPLSGGRNMTFIYPFVIIALSQIVDLMNNWKKSLILFFLTTFLFTSFYQVNYPNSYMNNVIDNVLEGDVIIVDYYLIPQYSLYSNKNNTLINRRYFKSDECLYSSPKEQIIFLQDSDCNPLVFEIKENYNNYDRVIFLSEENNFNKKNEVKELLDNQEYSLTSETQIGKTYKLIYEK